MADTLIVSVSPDGDIQGADLVDSDGDWVSFFDADELDERLEALLYVTRLGGGLIDAPAPIYFFRGRPVNVRIPHPRVRYEQNLPTDFIRVFAEDLALSRTNLIESIVRDAFSV